MPVIKRLRDARCYRAARFIGDQRNVFAWLHTQARFHGVVRAWHQIFLWWTEYHHLLFYRILAIFKLKYAISTCSSGRAALYPAARLRRSTRNAGTCPPPDVTFASPVALNRVKNPQTFPRKRYGAKSTSMSR